MQKRKKGIFFVMLLAFVMLIFNNINLFKIYTLSDNFYTNYSEIQNANKEGIFGDFVTISLNQDKVKTDSDKNDKGTILFKLFGFIPIKKMDVKIIPEDNIYIGGTAIGLSVSANGALVVSDVVVNAKDNQIIKNKNIKSGDIITKINDNTITCVEDIDLALQNVDSEETNIEIIRDNKPKTLNVGLLKDSTNHYRLGVWVKNNISGIGTLTFVKKNGDYGALGHPVTNTNSDTVVPIIDGNIYECNLIGVNKGQRNKPGELKGVFLQKNPLGEISKNTPYGIFGNTDNIDQLVDINRSANIGGRLSVKPGKAKIISSISGIQEEYDIEIIKANYQSKSSDKSLVFRVTDERLLKLTGGIVQGMSGSPIIQNDKLVGAVTHVFLSDPSKGYGIYSDWMLEQL